MLLDQLREAVSREGISEVAIAGGVSANSGLRAALKRAEAEEGWTIHIPPMAHCTDNAAMIAAVGWLDFHDGWLGTLDAAPSPRLPELTPLGRQGER